MLQKPIISLLFLVVFLFPKKQGAQFIVAGSIDTGDVYTDVVPDSLIKTILNHASDAHENFSFDLDQNGTPDFMFYNDGYWSNAGSSSTITLKPLTSRAFIITRPDTSKTMFSPEFYIREVADTLSVGDTINDSCDFKNIEAYIGEAHGGGHPGAVIYDWAGIGDHFVGLCLQTPLDTLYGWVRISVTGSGSAFYTTIRDYACNKNRISNNMAYPNPATDIIYFSLPGDTQWAYSLYDELGRLINNGSYDGKNGMDIYALERGLYIIRFSANGSTYKYRFVKTKW